MPGTRSHRRPARYEDRACDKTRAGRWIRRNGQEVRSTWLSQAPSSPPDGPANTGTQGQRKEGRERDETAEALYREEERTWPAVLRGRFPGDPRAGYPPPPGPVQPPERGNLQPEHPVVRAPPGRLPAPVRTCAGRTLFHPHGPGRERGRPAFRGRRAGGDPRTRQPPTVLERPDRAAPGTHRPEPGVPRRTVAAAADAGQPARPQRDRRRGAAGNPGAGLPGRRAEGRWRGDRVAAGRPVWFLALQPPGERGADRYTHPGAGGQRAGNPHP